MYYDIEIRNELREILIPILIDHLLDLDWEIARDYNIDDYIDILTHPENFNTFTLSMVEQVIEDVEENAYDLVKSYCEESGCSNRLKNLLKDRVAAEFEIYSLINEEKTFFLRYLQREAEEVIKDRSYGRYDKKHYGEFWGEDYE